MKRVISLLLVVMCLASFGMVFAAPDIPTVGENKISGEGQTALQNLLGTVQWIAYIIAIGWLMYLGVKYVMASADEKATLKNGMVKYLVGALLIAFAGTIFGWIANSSLV